MFYKKKKKKKNNTWQAEDVALDATWQKDGNVFCFNIYIDSMAMTYNVPFGNKRPQH